MDYKSSSKCYCDQCTFVEFINLMHERNSEAESHKLQESFCNENEVQLSDFEELKVQYNMQKFQTLKKQLTTDFDTISCQHVPIKKRGRFSCVNCVLLKV